MTRAEQPTDVTDPTGGPLAVDSRERAVGALLRIPRLRKLWTAQFAGSVGDRLALLVLIALAVQAAADDEMFGGGYRGVGFAVAAVLGARIVATFLFGALLLGPVSALTAPGGGLDRRWTMIGCDGLRVALLIVAPLWIDWIGSRAIAWVLVTAFVVGVAERIWTVAKNSAAPAMLPGLAPAVPAAAADPAQGHQARQETNEEQGKQGKRGNQGKQGQPRPRRQKQAPVPTVRPSAEHLEALRRLDLRTSYGALPVAAAALVAVTLVGNLLGVGVEWFSTHQVALASDVAAGLFAASIATLYLLELPNAAGPRPRSPLEGLRRPKDGLPGPKGKGRTGAVPILVLSTAATCAAVAAAFALAVLHSADLGGGPVGFGLLALALTAGPVIGVRVAPRTLPALSRRRLLALAIAMTGLGLLLAGVVPDPTTVLLLALLAGVCLGITANTAHTLLDHESEDARRSRTTEHLHAVVHVFVALAAVGGPLLAAAIGPHRVDSGSFTFEHDGAAFTLMFVGALLFPVAALVLARTDDRQGVSLRRDLRDALLSGPEPLQRPAETGFFIALEGGDGAGKSTQVELLAEWIRAKGHEVVVTREPGATAIGKRLRSILLDISSTGLSHRAEALLYAADRAEHVDSVVRPALARGAVVITDRYIDSSIAYQGAGRDLSPIEVARISRWATDGLVPHLTVLLDIALETARERFTEAPDRLESEPAEFHQRVRGGFLALAAADPSRYLVVDAGQDPDAVTTAVRHRLDRELPLSEQEIRAREEAERKAAEEARKRAEEEAKRKAEEERQEKERQEQLAKLRAAEEARRREALEEARRQEAERQAEEARRKAEEARRKAEEEARRRAAEEEVRRREEERVRRLAEEEERLRQEAEARRLEKQRKAEEALLRAEEARRRAEAETAAAEGAAAAAQTAETPQVAPGAPGAPGAPSDTTQTVETPMPAEGQRRAEPNDITQTVQTPRPDANPTQSDADETAVMPQVPEAGAADETAVIPRSDAPSGGGPGGDQGDHGDPANRVPPWLWRSEPVPVVERTREMPQVDPPEESGRRQEQREPRHQSDPASQPQPQPQRQPESEPRRRSRPRSDWAEETPLDDLPTLADELLGPRHDSDHHDRGEGPGPDQDQGEGGRRGRRGRG